MVAVSFSGIETMIVSSLMFLPYLFAAHFENPCANKYGKNINDETIIVSIPENDTATTGEWFMPHFNILVDNRVVDYFYSWSANGINQALSKRKYF